MPDAAPASLPCLQEVWREAQAVLLHHLQRRDAEHALQRLARAFARLIGQPCVLLGPVPTSDCSKGQRLIWLGGAQAELLVEPGWRLPLQHAGHPVGEFWLGRGPDGDPGEWEQRLAPMLDSAGALLAAVLEDRGLTPPASLSLVRAAMREAGCFVWEWDIATDQLTDIDDGALMLGYEPHSIGSTQEDWNALIHPEDAEAVEQAYQRHARGEVALYSVVYRARAADGDWRWLEERGRIIERDAKDQPRRMIGTQTDATLHHILEQARRDQLAAQAANQAKTQFLSRVSHELRTPLNAVLGFAQLLELDQKNPLTKAQLRQVGLIREAGAHLLAMIGDLLDVSLVETGRLPLQVQTIQLAPLLAQCVALVETEAEAAGVTLKLGRCAARIRLHADATRLKQVLINLLTNAIKYNRPQGQIKVSVRESDDGWVSIEVQDTGLGLTPEQLSRLFEPFNRLGREHGPVPGAGLGLALSQMLVQAMGGTLGATSSSSDTRFLMRLPAAAE